MQLYSLAETPKPPPPPCIWAHTRGRYWPSKIDDISLRSPEFEQWRHRLNTVYEGGIIVSQDRRHLFATPWVWAIATKVIYRVRSPKLILTPCAQLYSWLRQLSPPPPGVHIRGRFWSAKIDDISLWPLSLSKGDINVWVQIKIFFIVFPTQLLLFFSVHCYFSCNDYYYIPRPKINICAGGL